MLLVATPGPRGTFWKTWYRLQRMLGFTPYGCPNSELRRLKLGAAPKSDRPSIASRAKRASLRSSSRYSPGTISSSAGWEFCFSTDAGAARDPDRARQLLDPRRIRRERSTVARAPRSPCAALRCGCLATGLLGRPRLEDDERNLAIGARLVFPVAAVQIDHPRPQAPALRGRRDSSAHGPSPGPDLDGRVRIGTQVVEPRRVLWMPALRRDDDERFALAQVGERRGAPPAALSTDVVQQQHQMWPRWTSNLLWRVIVVVRRSDA